MRHASYGFTLVELLVVIGIIGILITVLVPVVKGAQIRAKEQVVKVNCGNIETALANYAQSHNGHYPGVAIDVMAPFADHAYGDPAYVAGNSPGPLQAGEGTLVCGVLGGFGHYNNNSNNVFQQLKAVKDSSFPGGGPSDIERYFDSLIVADAIQEYPLNPFVTSATTGERLRMRNIFNFALWVDSGFDPDVSFPFYTTGDGQYGAYLSLAGRSSAYPDPYDSRLSFFLPDETGPLNPSNWTSLGFSQACWFGTGTYDDGSGNLEDDWFAPGDFAYVPILTSSPYRFGDAAATLENEYYKWGSAVTGYMLFGFGHQSHKTKDFEEEQLEFVRTGIPGMGDIGVDSMYEWQVLKLFEGAIYFSKSY